MKIQDCDELVMEEYEGKARYMLRALLYTDASVDPPIRKYSLFLTYWTHEHSELEMSDSAGISLPGDLGRFTGLLTAATKRIGAKYHDRRMDES